MSLQGLLNKNGIGKTVQAEDVFLTFNRNIWLSRRVELIKDGNTYTLTVTDPNNLTKCWVKYTEAYTTSGNIGELCGGILSLITYLCTSILLAVPLAAGLIAKKISIQRNPEAKAYQNVIEKALAFSPYLDEISEQNAKNKLSIENNSDMMIRLEEVKRESELPQIRTKSVKKALLKDIKNLEKTIAENEKTMAKITVTAEKQSSESKKDDQRKYDNLLEKKFLLQDKIEFFNKKIMQIESDIKGNDLNLESIVYGKQGEWKRHINSIKKDLSVLEKELKAQKKKIELRQALEDAIQGYHNFLTKSLPSIEPNRQTDLTINIDIHPHERMIEEYLKNEEVELPA